MKIYTGSKNFAVIVLGSMFSRWFIFFLLSAAALDLFPTGCLTKELLVPILSLGIELQSINKSEGHKLLAGAEYFNFLDSF